MALGFTETGGGNGAITPIIKYDTRAGEFLRVDRSQDSTGTWVKSESELSYPIKLAMDFENIKVGYIGFVNGAPDFHLVTLGQPMPARPLTAAGEPSKDHNQGFQLRVANKELGLREFTSGTKTVTGQMDALHSQYEAGKASNPGKMPVVEITGAERFSIETPNGQLTFKKPIWNIVEWIDRPALFDGQAQAAPVATPEPVASAPVASTPPAIGGADLF